MKKQVDMLHGTIWDKIILFALPLAASSILQQLFNAADVAVVGRFSGSVALAAVGANGPVINLLVNLFVGLSIGTNVVVASFIGQNDYKRANKAVHTSIVLSLISGVALAVIGILFARPILEMISTPDDVLNLAVLYLKIYFAGMPFIMLYNFTSAILRSKGDTKRPLIALFVSGIINIILNIFFVVVLKMSVEGVALATVISQIISSLLLMYFLINETDALKVNLHNLTVDHSSLKQIAKIGVPAGLQGVVFSISNVIIQIAVNALGSSAIAASAAALNLEYFAYYICNSFAQAATTFLGQNYAAKNYQRCKQITRWTILLGSISTIIVCIVFILGHRFFMSFFTSDIAVANLAYTRIYIIIPFELLNMTIEIMSGALRGIGYSTIPAMIAVIGICVIRIIYIYTIYPSIASFTSLMLIYPVSWLFTAFALIFAYFIIQKKVYRISL